MAIMRKDNKERYTVVDNGIMRDDRLSLKDFGLLVQLLGKPDNWNFSEAGLMQIFKQDGQTSIRTALKNLEKYRYLKRRKLRDDRGRIIDVEWLISETPMSEEEYEKEEQESCDYPFFENHNLENPNLENALQYNTKEFKTEESNTDKEKETNKEKPSVEVNFDAFMQTYNNTCINLPKVREISDKREKAIKKFLTKYNAEDFQEVCRKANASDFLTGKSGSGFRGGFDFLIKLDNALKILEGNYDNSPAQQQKQQKQPRTNKFQNFEERNWDFAAIKKALEEEDEPNDGIITNYRPEPNNTDTTTKSKPQQSNSFADMMRKDSAKTKITGGTWL